MVTQTVTIKAGPGIFVKQRGSNFIISASGAGNGSGSGGGSVDVSDVVRYAEVQDAHEQGSTGSGVWLYDVKTWDTDAQDVVGDEYSVYSLNGMRYVAGCLVTLLYDDEAGAWVISDELGSHETPDDLEATSSAADTDTWTITLQSSTDGVKHREVSRTSFVGADNKLYIYSRRQTVGSLGQLQELAAEVRAILLPCGNYSSPDQLLRPNQSTTDTADWSRDSDTDGVQIQVCTGIRLDAVDGKLYSYYRVLSFDSLGMLKLASSETRVESINVTECV